MSLTAPPASTTVASALPLTTTFTPPPPCLTQWQTIQFTSGSLNTSYNRLGIPENSICMPTGWRPNSYYSPGLCPYNYTIATSSIDSALKETRAQCCPGGFNLNTNTYAYNKTEQCVKTTATRYFYSFVTKIVEAPAVSIRWRESDFSSSSSFHTPEENPTHISTSTKLGIGIGITIGLLITIILSFTFFYLKQFKVSRDDQESIADKGKALLRTFSYWRVMVLDSWFYEVIAICFSVACFVTLFYILQVYDQQQQPKFSYGLTLNTIVSVLATASKTSLVFLVGECIGQLRWVSFKGNSRPLNSIQTYDSASRGPWGSILILIKDKCRSLVTIGAMITILALAFDPFVQQIITYDIREAQVFSENAKIKQSRKVPVPYPGQTDMDFTSALSTAVWLNQTSVEPTCPSSDCTWPLFTQVEVCSQCEDVTHSATMVGCDNVIPSNNTEDTSCHLFIPDSLLPDLTRVVIDQFPEEWNVRAPYQIVWPSFVQDYKRGLHYSNGTKSNGNFPEDATPLLSNKTYAGMTNPLMGFAYAEIRVPRQANIGMGTTELLRNLSVTKATTCALSFCSKTYNVSVSSGRTSSQVIDTDYGAYYISMGGVLCWRSKSQPFNNRTRESNGWANDNDGQSAASSTQFDFCYGLDNLGNFDIQGGFQRLMSCTNTTCYGGGNGPPMNDSSQQISTIPGSAMKVLRARSLEAVVSNIASSLTRYACDSSESVILGSMAVTKSHVHVRWPWLILPAVLIVLGIILLGLTAFTSTKTKLWKTSVLPFLYHGLDKGLVANEDDLGCMSQMEGAADVLTVSLDYSNSEHRLMLREGEDKSKICK